VSSNVTAAAADAFTWNNAISGTTGLFANNAVVVAGVAAPAMAIAQNGGSNLLALDNSGNLGAAGIIVGQGVKSSSLATNYSFVPPVYTAAGASVASTLHIVQGTFTGTGGLVTVTLSGAAVFSSATSYWGMYYDNTIPATSINDFTQTSGSSLTTAINTVNAHSYPYLLIGT
jgi:hypothetical protein